MKIAKVINHNIVVVLDENHREQVVMGLGIGFKKKTNDMLDDRKVEKIFALKNDEITFRLSELLGQIPIEVMTTCDRIINVSKQKLGELQENIYISLTDHCYSALERHKKGINIRNVLLWEIKRLYPKEYQLGLEAIDIIDNRLGVRMTEDEAGFIALHLVTAQLGHEMPEVIHITQIVNEVLDITKYQLNLEYKEDNLSYHRFVTHLKFFAQRMLNRSTVQDDDTNLHSAIKINYSQAWECAEKIKAHLLNHYQYELTIEEVMFLAIHIEQIRKDNRC
ncbi:MULTISPECIES: BglG family transcription antiterminator LicT [unclassified Brenneria]|uniref:BglG family transcription antiterminator LicT n=1 Tax=unclassified Brenneria TaxID=2634434 RepID=UPI0029C249F5|nr:MULTISPECIES: transcriptional antiterminator BglG [unclassified Brenneria]MDX5628648.1 transcriptional antiterminator BglG [Brenneria sp. L3-3Z]MDX5695787.1 transcriptional antiterminator BglG [Brenneria sp. L4-2C]